MIIKMNKEVKELTNAQKEVLEQLGATIEDRPVKVYAKAFVDNDIDFSYVIPNTDGWKFISYLKSYTIHPDEIRSEEAGCLDEKNNTVIPIYAYIHSDISLSLENTWPYNDRWDSGLAGCAIFKGKATEKDLEALKKYIKAYNRFQTENFFYVQISNEFGEFLDSLSGLSKEDVVSFVKEKGLKLEDIEWS